MLFNPSGHLLGVAAAVGLGDLDGADGDAQAARVASGLRDTSVNPDAPGTVNAVGAGKEAGAVEGEVASGVESEVGALAVADGGLGAGGVAELALAHAGAVDKGLLGSGALGVQVKAALVEVEGGRIGGTVVARGVLRGQVEEDGAQSGIKLSKVDLAGRAEGHQAKRCAIGNGGLSGGQGRGGREAGNAENGDSLGVHFDGVIKY